MRRLGLICWLVILSIGLGTTLNAQFYNGSQMEFGQNRIQYKPINWEFYRYPKYDVFFYAGGKDLSHQAARIADEFLVELENRFNYELENRLQIILFNRLSDLRQTNLGSTPDMENNPGGMTRQVGNKVMVYYTNGFVPFVNQLKSGIAGAFIQEMLYGSNLKERMRSGTIIRIPTWFEKGLAKYLSEPWDARQTSRVRDGLISGRYFNLNRLEGEEAEIAGFSMWTFFARVYGDRIITDILNLTAEYRSADQGIQIALAQPVSLIWQEWLNFLDQQLIAAEYKTQPIRGTKISGKFRRGFTYSRVRMHPNGKQIAYVRNDHGKNTIWLYNTETGKRKRLVRVGKRLPGLPESSYPVIAWHPDGDLLVFTDEHKGRLRLNFYSVEKRTIERKFLNDLQKVEDFSIAPDGKRYALIGSRDGQTDLFLFQNMANTLTPITNDYWDEYDCSWMPDGKRILFSSNRSSDSLKHLPDPKVIPALNNDLFLFDTETMSPVVQRLTETPQANETQAVALPDGQFVWLSDENGIANRYVGRFDSTIAYIDTTTHYRYFMVSRPASNYNRSIDVHSHSAAGSSAEVMYCNGKQRVYFTSSDSLWAFGQQLPNAGKLEKARKKPVNNRNTEPEPRSKLKKILVFGNKTQQSREAEKEGTRDTFRISKQRMYETAWYTDYLITRIDRSFLNQVYQPYSNYGYFNPSLNGMFRLGISDLFEDYRITGGVRLSGNLTGNEYLCAFQDMKKRLDKTIVFHRQGIQSVSLDATRNLAHTVLGKLSYPFSEVARISASAGVRYDRNVYLSVDLANLIQENQYRYWAQPKLEFVFDNSFPAGQNMVMGSRIKLTAEYFRNIRDKNQSTFVLGGDVRRYERIDREMIVALRAAAGTSMGPGKLLYYLGGVDNWFVPRFDDAALPGPDANYMFQTLATNMRGFYQNVRNGNSFGVINAEFRWNFVRYFSRFTLRSEFFNSLQAMAFADAGTAFTGPSPYSDENIFNQRTITSGPITVVLKNQEEPIVLGYGFGLRGKLLGYFVRADLSWGINDGRRLPSLFYLSLCNDF